MNIEIRQSPSVTPPADLSSTGKGQPQDVMSLFDSILRAPPRATERAPAEPSRSVDSSPRDNSPKPRDTSNDAATQRPAAKDNAPKVDSRSPNSADQKQASNSPSQAAKRNDQPSDKRDNAPAGKTDAPASADAASTDEKATEVVPTGDEVVTDKTAEPAADEEAAATATDAAQQLAATLAVKADKTQQPGTDPAADPNGNGAKEAAADMALDGAEGTDDATSPPSTTAASNAVKQAAAGAPQPLGTTAAVADGTKVVAASADANQAATEQAVNTLPTVDPTANAEGDEKGDAQGKGVPQAAVAANVAAPVVNQSGEPAAKEGKGAIPGDEPTLDSKAQAAGGATAPEVAAGLQETTATQGAKEKKRDEKGKENEHALDATKPAETSPLPEPVVGDLPLVEPPPVEGNATSAPVAPAHETSHAHHQPLVTDPQNRAASPARLAASLLAPAHREERDSQPVEVDSARFLHRVARAFTSAQQRGGEVQLRLSPPELGSLRIEVKVHDGVLTARVETDNSVARAAVVEHLPQLRDRLAEQGVRIERFDVDLMQQSSTGTPDGSHDRQPNAPAPHRPRTIAAAASGAASDVPRAAQPVVGNGRLNVVI